MNLLKIVLAIVLTLGFGLGTLTQDDGSIQEPVPHCFPCRA